MLQTENSENLSTLYKPNIHLISLIDTDRAILICATANSIMNISKKGLDSQICKKKESAPTIDLKVKKMSTIDHMSFRM